MLTSLALFGPIGTWEAIVLLGLGLLIFGRRLPEVVGEVAVVVNPHAVEGTAGPPSRP